VSSALSSNTDNKPGVGENVALIAMVLVLSKVWPRRRCALAVNRVERLGAYVRVVTMFDGSGK
jgi:hypothetical protein